MNRFKIGDKVRRSKAYRKRVYILYNKEVGTVIGIYLSHVTCTFPSTGNSRRGINNNDLRLVKRPN